jgi:hypothetical protein
MIQVHIYETLIGKDMYDSIINSPKGFATNKSGNIKKTHWWWIVTLKTTRPNLRGKCIDNLLEWLVSSQMLYAKLALDHRGRQALANHGKSSAQRVSGYSCVKMCSLKFSMNSLKWSMECEGDLVRAYDFGTSQLVNKLNLGPGVSMGFTLLV